MAENERAGRRQAESAITQTDRESERYKEMGRDTETLRDRNGKTESKGRKRDRSRDKQRGLGRWNRDGDGERGQDRWGDRKQEPGKRHVV